MLVKTALLVVLIAGVAGATEAQEKEQILQQILDNALDNHDLFGATFAVSSGDGALVIQAAAGTMDLNTQYSLASITKMFTGAVIYKLREMGRLSMDDKAYKYLGKEVLEGLDIVEGVDYSKEITIRQLLSQTSGLPDYWSECRPNEKTYEEMRKEIDRTYSILDILTVVRSLEPHFKPGEAGKAYYSDTNYQLLGLIIEKITRKPLAAAYQEFIFSPLQLKKTYLYELGMKVEMAPFYYQQKTLLRPQYLASEKATGGIVSNTAELMIFLKAYFSGTLFPKKYLAENTQWKPIQYAPIQYGTNLMKIGNLVGHSGSTGTIAYYNPDSDMYIVGATGQLDTYKAMMLTIRIVQSLGYAFVLTSQ